MAGAGATQALEKPVRLPALQDKRYPVHLSASLLEPYLQAIINAIHPLRIILFGSHAYGVPDQNSDFDLLIIRKTISSSKASNMEIRYAVSDVNAPPVSFTFLSQTPEGLQEKLTSGSFVYREIMARGLELYAAEENQ
jgi:hypothetical protein